MRADTLAVSLKYLTHRNAHAPCRGLCLLPSPILVFSCRRPCVPRLSSLPDIGAPSISFRARPVRSQTERELRMAAQTMQAETAHLLAQEAQRLEAALAHERAQLFVLDQQFVQLQAEVVAREDELREILSSAAEHIGKLEEQVRLTNADVAVMKAQGLAQQEQAEIELSNTSQLALEREANLGREVDILAEQRDDLTALNAHLSTELAAANDEISRLSASEADLRSARARESLTSAACEAGVARAVTACLGAMEEVQLLASSAVLELRIDQRRCIKGQPLLVLVSTPRLRRAPSPSTALLPPPGLALAYCRAIEGKGEATGASLPRSLVG